jgi:hypothetical protein
LRLTSGNCKVFLTLLVQNESATSPTSKEDTMTPADKKLFAAIYNAKYMDHNSAEELDAAMREGASLDAVNDLGFKPLHYAAILKRPDMVTRLVDKYKANPLDTVNRMTPRQLYYWVDPDHPVGKHLQNAEEMWRANHPPAAENAGGEKGHTARVPEPKPNFTDDTKGRETGARQPGG